MENSPVPPKSPWDDFQPHRPELPKAGKGVFVMALFLGALFGGALGGVTMLFGIYKSRLDVFAMAASETFAYTFPRTVAGAVIGAVIGAGSVWWYWDKEPRPPETREPPNGRGEIA